jgi:hypothetical protein
MKPISTGGASVPANRDNSLPKAAREDARHTKFVVPLLAALVLFLAVSARAETTNDSFDAIVQGRNLALQLLEQRPTESFSKTGVLKIRDAKRLVLEIQLRCETIVTRTNWLISYEAKHTNGTEYLIVRHPIQVPTGLEGDYPEGKNIQFTSLPNSQIKFPAEFMHSYPTYGRPKMALTDRSTDSFARSDFSVADLILEFFHWPAQKVLPKTTDLKRGREYTLLESTNPNPPTNGYSRVLSWIDKESGGILEAEAYDANGKLLKEFAPGRMKKVNGQWQLQSMEMNNVQTGSRSRIEFNLGTE